MSMFEEVDPVRDDEVGARTARLLPGVGGDSECYKYLCCLFSADHHHLHSDHRRSHHVLHHGLTPEQH